MNFTNIFGKVFCIFGALYGVIFRIYYRPEEGYEKFNYILERLDEYMLIFVAGAIPFMILWVFWPKKMNGISILYLFTVIAIILWGGYAYIPIHGPEPLGLISLVVPIIQLITVVIFLIIIVVLNKVFKNEAHNKSLKPGTPQSGAP